MITLSESPRSAPTAPNLGRVDDWSRLALLARAGDADAFAQLVLASQLDLRRFCGHMTDHQRADDLAQEIYLRIWSRLSTWTAEVPVRAWMLGIARHVIADDVRRTARRRRLAPVEPFDLRSEPEPIRERDHGHRPDQVVDVIVLRDLLGALDDDQRSAMVLTQVLGCSYAEAAEICGVAIGTIRSRVARARAELGSRVGMDQLVDGDLSVRRASR
jgi:RNA polymerase sigma-70 factor, ECF subfamily